MSRIAIVALAVAFFAVAVVAQAQQQPATAPNPNLTPRCGLKVIVVLDASYSIQQSKGTEDVRNAAKTFIGAFAGTGTQIAMFDFALNARVNVDVPYTEVTDGSVKVVFNPAANAYTPLTKSPDYYTNWDNALLQARYTSDSSTPRANAVVFITDGDPTALNTNHGKPTEVTVPGAATSSSANTLNNAITHANELKAEGTHIFAFGVGNGVTNAASQSRLKAISGNQEFEPGVPVGSVDWVVVANFGDLSKTLADLATSLCASSVRVTKRVDEDGDGSYDDPAGGWTFTGNAAMSTGSYEWRQPAGSSTPGQRKVTVTNDNPTAMFEWDPQNAKASASFTFSEGARLGYRFVDANCGGRSVTRDGDDFTVVLPAGESASCVVRNARLREVTFCHATGDSDDPYDIRTAFLDAAGRALLAEHSTHDGPVFPAPNWGDIIPPYVDDPVGLNWSGVGQIVWQNKCVIPPAVRLITPSARCVEVLDNGDLRAHFGYTNPSAEALNLL
ncbi:MAG TPA: vWA domain-containing protein, partial [Solirubrobacter sp.]